jgi:hypothetical protein
MASKFRQIRSIDVILKSPKLRAQLEDIGQQVLDAASTDPNQAYVDTLEMHTFESSSRVTVQVGAAPMIGMAVEAKRGTLARALGSVT